MRVPSRGAVRLLVNKFREKGSIFDKKRNVKRRVLTEQKLEEIGERFRIYAIRQEHGCANHATEGKCFCPPSAAVT